MADLDQALSDFQTLVLAQHHFPMWTDWGVEHTRLTVHSLGLSYLLTLGQAAGYAACCEVPVSEDVRADCVWWNKTSRDPVAVFEFERHKGGSELKDKVRNLLIAYQHFEARPQMLVLIAWTENFYPLPDEEMRGLWGVFQHGFAKADRSLVRAASPALLRVFECLHSQSSAGRIILKQIVQRRPQ